MMHLLGDGGGGDGDGLGVDAEQPEISGGVLKMKRPSNSDFGDEPVAKASTGTKSVPKSKGETQSKAKSKGKLNAKPINKINTPPADANASESGGNACDADEDAIGTLVAVNRDVVKARKWRSMFETSTLPPHALAAYDQQKKESCGGKPTQTTMTDFINDAIEKHVSVGGKTHFSVALPDAPVFTAISQRVREVVNNRSARGVFLEEAMTICGGG